MVQAEGLTFEYFRRDENGDVESIQRAIDDISFKIKKGSFVAILGHNGSGKSTLAKHLNVLLTPSEGTILIDGMDTKTSELRTKIRQTAGMIFQNPDNQFVANIIEEDVGFGPENLGVPTDSIWKRVESALSRVGMIKYRKESPNRLSGGQKQRAAIAGVIAMKPQCIVADEPTAMLDPQGRKEVLDTLYELNQKEKITIILITHHMEEVTHADQVIVMDHGSIVMEGVPEEIFARDEELEKLGLTIPYATDMARELKRMGITFPKTILTTGQLVESLYEKSYQKGNLNYEVTSHFKEKRKSEAVKNESKKIPQLVLDHVEYLYSKGTTYENIALQDISLAIYPGEKIAILGQTGSGKSTLIQMLNGLLTPSQGKVYYQGEDVAEKEYDRRKLRTQVGLVFQYPEYQLFEATVQEDVKYGPRNMGLDSLEVDVRSYDALKQVGISEDYLDSSPFELSGGQKRRVAIAGILAMHPQVLILDEPVAGLDAEGKKHMFAMLEELHQKEHTTIILVSHSMEDSASFADRILVMNQGRLCMDGTAKEVFSQPEKLIQMGLDLPEPSKVLYCLQKKGIDFSTTAVASAKEAADVVVREYI